ncbi:MAG: FecCD family ABC transporter permease [Desulfovibrio sp.]|uniref:FecCD family ABC transporter permease n=1 Tax=Desulfovibrio sp. 7SRBS1 TaxID=3378064 RepID=UPI003B3FC319
MHFNDGQIPSEYMRYVGRKTFFIVLSAVILAALLIYSVGTGAVHIPPLDVLDAFRGAEVSKRFEIIIWNIRLPQALAAIVAGVGLSASGLVMQSVLRNPLGSPITLGLTHAAAFGAAFSVMVLGSGVMASSNVGAVTINNPSMTIGVAFAFSMLTTLIIVGVARMRGTSPEVMILTGVALNALFTAGTLFLQYFADDVQLAAMVFWTFGDAARADWAELGIMSGVTVAAVIYFLCNRWNYNAMDAGNETAKGLGVKVESVRLWGMVVAALVTSVLVSFLGIISFVGLICPHMVRRVVGDDHRFLMPATAIVGGALLLASDTVARTILAPNILPVSILTAFLGAPVFIYLILTRYSR